MSEIDTIYAAVPSVACKGLCQRACGPIDCSAAEKARLQDNGISLPTIADHPTQGALTCSHLTAAGRCAIYEHRPMVCRLFGAVKALQCPHGCKPADGYMPDEVARALLRRLNGIAP